MIPRIFSSLVVFLVATSFSPAGRAQAADESFSEPEGVLRLADAIEAALLGNPDLAPFSWDIRVAGAQVVQAGLRPNPVLSAELENVRLGGGGGSASRGYQAGLSFDGVPGAGFEWSREQGGDGVFSQAEITLRLSQVIELGGKRAARVAAAERGREVAAWDYEVARYEVVGAVVAAFVDLLGAQEAVRQFGQMVALGEELTATVSKLVEAGRVSPLEQRRAESEVESLRVELRQRERAVDQARIRLAALWGSPEPRFDRAEGDIAAMPPLPPLAELLARREANPLLGRWTAELARREAVLDLENRRATPDLELTAGYRAAREAGGRERAFEVSTDGVGFGRSRTDLDGAWEHSLTFEFSIPLPLFDRNQGARQEAAYQVEKAAAERRATINRLDARLAEYHAAAAGAYEAASALRDAIIPGMEETFALTREGYRSGKFDFLTVLDAERQLIDARLRATDAELMYHSAVAALEQTLGSGVAYTGEWPAAVEPAAADAAPERAPEAEQ